MPDINRRKLLTSGSAAVGLTVVPSIGAASSDNKDADQEKVNLNDNTVLFEDKNKRIIGVDLSKTSDKKGEENTADRRRFITVTDKESGSVSLEEVSAQRYDELTNKEEMTAAGTQGTTAANSSPVTTADDAAVVEYSDTYWHNKGSCDVYDDHTHVWAGVSAQFANEIGDLSWASVSAALISIVGSSSLSAGISAILVAGITFVGGVAAYVTNTYALTFGVEEWDQSALIKQIPMYSIRTAPGYHLDEDELKTITPVPNQHPTRPHR
ncbi:hypothetical protein HTG_16650 [Natrinema mahii]|nr:hypothetical protein HTG_16650 [Natrinema mahii]